MAKKRKRNRKSHREDFGDLSPEELLVHRELQALRAAAWTVKKKPGQAARIRGRSGGKPNRSWVEDRFRKLAESRRGVAAGPRNEGLGGGSAATL